MTKSAANLDQTASVVRKLDDIKLDAIAGGYLLVPKPQGGYNPRRRRIPFDPAV